MHDVFLTVLCSADYCPRASCEDRCGKSSPDDDSLCSCDHRCQLLGDCCEDFSRECSGLAIFFLGKQYKTNEINLAVIKNSNTISPEQEKHLFIGFRQIDHCPKSSTLLLHDKCRDARNKDDLGQEIPVCHSEKQVVFQNQYCAYCNGYRMRDLVSFELHFDITSACKEPNIHVSGSNKSRMSLERMVNECSTWRVFFVPNLCFAAVYRNKLYGRRDQSMCRSYLNPVISTNSGVVYQNKHCFPQGITDFECFNGEWPSPAPVDVPSEVNNIISLDNAGVPFLHDQLPSPSKAAIKCASFHLLLAINTGLLL